MARLFIFTAGNPSARGHLSNSITNSIDKELVLRLCHPSEKFHLQQVHEKEKGLYAWGAIPGKGNQRNWEAMDIGDLVLCVYDSHYHFLSTVHGKINNEALAKEIWGEENGKTWQLMYFLSKPLPPVNGPIPLFNLENYLNQRYLGFSKISDEKLNNINNQFGSIHTYLSQWFQIKVSRGPVGQELEKLKILEEKEQEVKGAFDPKNITDARKKVIASLVQRQGQPRFRRTLLEIYDGRCAISGCDVPQALEAAHIIPYRGEDTNHPSNGVLLRADLHSLFDLGYISIDPGSYRVTIAPELIGTVYESLNNHKINLPSQDHQKPSNEALQEHLKEFGFKR